MWLVRVIRELLGEDIVEAMAEVMAELSPRERDVLSLRFGLDDGRQRTLEEVGQLFGVTRERIRQIEAKALRKLRHPKRGQRRPDPLAPPLAQPDKHTNWRDLVYPPKKPDATEHPSEPESPADQEPSSEPDLPPDPKPSSELEDHSPP
jgi:hypothetical protein